jgi:hypothetical protein
METLATNFMFTVRASLADTIIVGEMPRGLRRFVPITGGTVRGPAFSGSVAVIHVHRVL